MIAKTFEIGQAVKITRGTDRGRTGVVTGIIGEQVIQYVIRPDAGQGMNTAAPIVKASSLKAL